MSDPTPLDPVAVVPETELAIITWRGQTFKIPPTLDDCDIDVLEAFETGKSAGLIRLILGDKQYLAMKKAVKPKVRDLTELAEVIAGQFGFANTGE